MKVYNIFTAATTNYINVLRLICLGLKKYKGKDVKYVYHIMLDSYDIEQYRNSFSDLQKEDFEVELISATESKSRINAPEQLKMTYVKCLAPSLFPQVDKILWIDADILVAKEGIDLLFESDMNDNYVIAAYDIPVQLCNYTMNSKEELGVRNYFNAGVMLLNLKNIRKDGIDRILQKDLLSWPKEIRRIQHDQTLFNYRFKQKAIFISPTYNNMVLGSADIYVSIYTGSYMNLGWNDLLDSLDDSIMIHFTSIVKPWSDVIHTAPDSYRYPFKREAIKYYNLIRKQLEEYYEQEKSTKI